MHPRLTGVCFLSASCLLLACGSDPPAPPAASSAAPPVPSPSARPTPDPWSFPQAPPAEDALATVTEPELRDRVYYLASEALAGRRAGEGGDMLAAEYVARQFREAGLRPGHRGEFLQPVTAPDGPSANAVGYLPGTDPGRAGEVIVVGGHLDHLGGTPPGHYPGADDNASGTAAVVELAEALAQVAGGSPRSIVFVGITAEEGSGRGSRQYLSDPTFPLAQTVYMINLDMVGRLREGRLHVYGAAESAPLGAVVAELGPRYPGLVPSAEGNRRGSDDMLFREVGIPTLFFHTGMSPEWHTPRDTPESLNYPGLTVATRFAFELLWRISNGTRAGGLTPLRPLLWDGPWLDHDMPPAPSPADRGHVDPVPAAPGLPAAP